MRTDAEATLKAGAEILESVMQLHGFGFVLVSTGVGSGGMYAAGEFRRGNRVLELHFRHSLGLASYRVGSLTLSHEDYMWSVVGHQYGTRYPGFSTDPLDGFRELLADMKEHCADFFAESDFRFAEHVERATRLRESAPKIP